MAAVEPPASEESQSLVDRIRAHYDLCSSYYYNLWGEHIHHGLWLPTDPSTKTKEQAQIDLISLLLQKAQLSPASTVNGKKLKCLDVGCGVGGTTRYLAKELGMEVTGITLSSEQVKMAYQLSKAGVTSKAVEPKEGKEERVEVGELGGSVGFVQLDAALMLSFFQARAQEFDVVWISEALSHIPDKPLFFSSASQLLSSSTGGKLVIADWFMAERIEVGDEEWVDDIKPIEDGMLLPPLGTMSSYEKMAAEVGFQGIEGGWQDVSKEVAKTWDISLSLISSPSLWAFAFTAGRDAVAFLKAFQAMRRGYSNGSFVYGVRAWEKK